MADHLDPAPGEQVLVAPPRLVRPASEEFRQRALVLLDRLPEGRGRLVLDLSATEDADSEGMAALIAIRRRARQRRQGVSLRGVTPSFMELLRLAKLDRQFETDRPEGRR